MDFYASAPRGVSSLLTGELRSLGIEQLRETGTGVFFSGPLQLGYLACLWSRLANRVTLQIAQFAAARNCPQRNEVHSQQAKTWVPVAQLDRASASEAEGYRFESCRA